MRIPPVYKDELDRDRVCGACFVKWARYKWRGMFRCKPCLEREKRKYMLATGLKQGMRTAAPDGARSDAND